VVYSCCINGASAQSCGCHMGSHTHTLRDLHIGVTDLPPDTSEHAALAPARQAGTQFPCPWRVEGWVDL